MDMSNDRNAPWVAQMMEGRDLDGAEYNREYNRLYKIVGQFRLSLAKEQAKTTAAVIEILQDEPCQDSQPVSPETKSSPAANSVECQGCASRQLLINRIDAQYSLTRDEVLNGNWGAEFDVNNVLDVVDALCIWRDFDVTPCPHCAELKAGIVEPKEEWSIRHPGGMGTVDCASFDEALRWYEGFNMPTKIIDGVPEDFKESHKRMEDYHHIATDKPEGG